MNCKRLITIVCIASITFSNLSFNAFAKNLKVTDKNISNVTLSSDKNENIIEDKIKSEVKKDMFTKNREKIERDMKDNSLLVLFSGKRKIKTFDIDYEFTPNKNFYYFAGVPRANSFLVISKTDNKIHETLFVDMNTCYMDDIKTYGIEDVRYILEFEDSQRKYKSFITPTNYDNYYKEVISLIRKNNYENLYVDISYRDDENGNEITDSMFNVMRKNKNVNIININNTMAEYRGIKTVEEIETIQKAVNITSEGIKKMMGNIKPGMMEYELEAYYDFAIKSNGIREYAFPSIIASGRRGLDPHYQENNEKIDKDVLITCDVGVEYKQYNTDITRTFPVNGKFTVRQKEIYNIVLNAQLEVIKAIKPGVKKQELEKIATDFLAKECKKMGIIKEESEINKVWYHAVAHHLGLDTHDLGTFGELKEGMVFAVEPALYIDKEGIGIRIEDDVVVTKNGCEVLSKNLPKTVKEIEKYMNENKK